MTTYRRVIPRDLFNEAKHLKCLARLCLLIHDGRAGRLQFHHDAEVYPGFSLESRWSDGGVYCENLKFTIDEREVKLYGWLNARSPYPLLFQHEGEELDVFHDDGSLTAEFRELILGETDGPK